MSRRPAEARLVDLWGRLSPLPGGRWLFSRVLGWIVPYSGTVRPLVVELEPGRAVVRVRDRRKIRQHLGSVHAVALCNLGELTSGLAMMAGLSPSVRGIVTSIEIEFFKKARGLLTATSEARAPEEVHDAMDHPVVAEIHDEAGDCVARVTAHWRLAPRPPA
ncbi:MAG: DUF4442 domain-containing protein [Gemmatimonadetes bacterium]|nr:DUF4442 domain-containing protein [Gemmatimonadota bacterium]